MRVRIMWRVVAWRGVLSGVGWRGLTFHGSGAALDGEEDSQDGVSDTVIQHVALPFDRHLAAVLAPDRDAAHDQERCALRVRRARDLVVGWLVVLRVPAVPVRRGGGGSVGLFAFAVEVELLDRAESALQRPSDQIDAGRAQREPLLARDGRRRQAGVLSQVLGRHQRHLEVVLYEYPRDDLRLVAFRVLRGRDLGELADYFGRFDGLEWDLELFAVGGAVDFDFGGFVGVEGEELRFQSHHVVLFAVHQDLTMVIGIAP